jgi:NAD(P)-dependent dehydrogenase (short-subunit alcohol dehydrogenase family)
MNSEKVVIIGGTSGMGLATAALMLKKNKEVIICGRNNERLESALSRLPGAKGISADANSAESLDSLFSEIGIFDHLVITLSGNKGFGMFRELKIDDIETGFHEKVSAQMRAAQSSLKTIRPNGSITFVTASSAQSSGPGISGYAAINGAIECMIPPLARELAPVRVNAVSPGIIDTPWWEFMGEAKDEVFSHSKETLPAGKIGTVENIAPIILMLTDNDYITGTIIIADGGGHLL